MTVMISVKFTDTMERTWALRADIHTWKERNCKSKCLRILHEFQTHHGYFYSEGAATSLKSLGCESKAKKNQRHPHGSNLELQPATSKWAHARGVFFFEHFDLWLVVLFSRKTSANDFKWHQTRSKNVTLGTVLHFIDIKTSSTCLLHLHFAIQFGWSPKETNYTDASLPLKIDLS